MATPQLVIDTNIIIDYLRHRRATLEAALGHYNCAVTAITTYELRIVPALSTRQKALLQQLDTVLHILPFDAAAATIAADLWRELAQKGASIGLPDTLIAGVCLANNLPLLTENERHFGRVVGLQVITPDEWLESHFAIQ